MQRTCSEYAGKALPKNVAERIERPNLATSTGPRTASTSAIGKSASGSRRKGAACSIRTIPRARSAPTASLPQLAPQELSYGTIGPELYQFGKVRGYTDDMRKYATARSTTRKPTTPARTCRASVTAESSTRSRSRTRGSADGSGFARQQVTRHRKTACARRTRPAHESPRIAAHAHPARSALDGSAGSRRPSGALFVGPTSRCSTVACCPRRRWRAASSGRDLASWCPFCARQNPHFKELYAAQAGRGLEFLTFSIDRDPAKARAYMAEHRYTFGGPWPRCEARSGWDRAGGCRRCRRRPRGPHRVQGSAGDVHEMCARWRAFPPSDRSPECLIHNWTAANSCKCSRLGRRRIPLASRDVLAQGRAATRCTTYGVRQREPAAFHRLPAQLVPGLYREPSVQSRLGASRASLRISSAKRC